MELPSVAVVVPVHDRLDLTRRFLDSFDDVSYPNYKLIFVDDGSRDGTGDWLASQHPEVAILKGDGNLWWTGGTNRGVQHAIERGFDYVFTVNNDSVVSEDLLTRLLQTARHFRTIQGDKVPGANCIVGSRLDCLQQPDRVWCVGGWMDWTSGRPFRHHHSMRLVEEVLREVPHPTEVEIVTGCGTLIPVECFREVGLYDEVWFPQYHADSEFVLRARRAGYQCLVEPRAGIRNDVQATWHHRSWWEVVWSRRSPYFWRPMLMIHLRYCPWWLIPWSLLRLYVGTFYCLWRQSRLKRSPQ